MRLSKIGMAFGALALTAGAVFAGRATAKFTSATKLYRLVGTQCTFITNVIASSSAFTTGGTGTQASIKTSGGSAVRVALYGTSLCNAAHAVHFHP